MGVWIVMVHARDVFDFLRKIGATPDTLEQEYLERVCASIGAELLAYRKQHNLTQKELAQRLGISQKMLSQIEMGTMNLSLKTLIRIANTLGGELKVSLGILSDGGEENG
ncbi:MAG: helix-turn-helix transcriptional regulator [Desulfurococcales archaeon]|nr:helix-turn-helix transcriptional regulator [Desulfurococcales archaeon]